MNYVEEKVEEFKRLFPCTYDQMSEDITTTHELFLRKALQEVDRRAREEERKKMREEEDNYNENTLNA